MKARIVDMWVYVFLIITGIITINNLAAKGVDDVIIIMLLLGFITIGLVIRFGRKGDEE